MMDDGGILTSSIELRELFDSTFEHQQKDIAFAFGYGSGVFLQQDGDDEGERKTNELSTAAEKEKKMLDMILIVKDAQQFHKSNLETNPHHYAPLFRDATRATWWQKHETVHLTRRWIRNPKVFFNFVEEPFMKYGVVELSDLGSDLKHWDSLYIAGRMHKPTATVMCNKDGKDQISRWQNQHNLPAALSAALLLTGITDDTNQAEEERTISLAELYSQISSLSYTGDFRMQVGAEDPGKIKKLVHSPGQLKRFHQMYNRVALQPLVEEGVLSLNSTTSSSSSSNETTITWNPVDPATRKHLWQRLPEKLQHLQPSDNNGVAVAVDKLHQNLHQIVAPAARYQSFKGLWTAGLSKSARYAAAKLAKGIMRKK